MAEISKREMIKKFREYATEEDFEKLKERIENHELFLTMTRDRSRKLLKQVHKAYYFVYFSLAIALAVFTIYLVVLGQNIAAILCFGVTLMVFTKFWTGMTRKMLSWALEDKKNFDYTYFNTAISIKKEGEGEEFSFPMHWKDILLDYEKERNKQDEYEEGDSE